MSWFAGLSIDVSYLVNKWEIKADLLKHAYFGKIVMHMNTNSVFQVKFVQ